MSGNVPEKKVRLKHLERISKLIKGLREGKPFYVIAEECGVTEKTIDRDFKEWKDNGGFDKWLLQEFMFLHDVETQQEKSQAYRIVADLLKKRLKEQSEVEVKGVPKLTVEIVDHVKNENTSSQETADSS